jgi:hypothetical protein
MYLYEGSYVSYCFRWIWVDATIENEIAKDLLRQEGKPEAMLDNKGKLARFFKR